MSESISAKCSDNDFNLAHTMNDLKKSEERILELTALSDQRYRDGVKAGKEDSRANFAVSVMDYSEGCRGGKESFLDEMGLLSYLPNTTCTVTFSVVSDYLLEDDRYESERDIISCVENLSFDYGSASSVSVEWD